MEVLWGEIRLSFCWSGVAIDTGVRYDIRMNRTPREAVQGSPLGVDAGALVDAWDRLAGVVGDSAVADAQRARVDAMRALEDVKCAAAAAQAELAVAIVRAEVAAAEAACDAAERDTAERDAVARDGFGGAVESAALSRSRAGSRVRERKVMQARRSGIGQVALARRESPARAQVLVGVGEALVNEMPHTLAAVRCGAVNEYRAQILVTATACLDKEARARVDRELCSDPGALQGVGTKRLKALVERAAYREDPVAVVRRNERCEAERGVSMRPAPGGMVYLTTLVPLAQGVAVYANLQRTADAARASGDERSRAQLMADTLVERVTGQATADAVPVAVNLIMSDATLLASGHEPAVMDGGHMVPAQAARELVATAMDSLETLDDVDLPVKVGAWVRRVYADAGGNLIAMDSRRRTFPEGLGALLRVRDQGLCRTPWCDAPIAHADHVTPHVAGGATSAANGQGLCAGCNYTKQANGWTQHADPDAPRHTVTTVTPTGHTYTSTAPAAPTPLRRRAEADVTYRDESPVEIAVERFILHAA